MLKQFVSGAALTLALLLGPASVPAGDDVDYSAPYLVVENGELVTKYPALEHQGAGQGADAQAAGAVETQPPTNKRNSLRVLAVAAIGAVLALLLMVKRRRQAH